MTEEYIKTVKELLETQKYDLAEERLNKHLQLEPEDLSAKILLGICRLLQGDTETAEQIHKEVKEKVETRYSAFTSEEMRFWQVYDREIHSLLSLRKLGVEFEKRDNSIRFFLGFDDRRHDEEVRRHDEEVRRFVEVVRRHDEEVRRRVAEEVRRRDAEEVRRLDQELRRLAQEVRRHDFLECNCVYGGAPFTIYCTVCGETQSIRMGWDPESETERLYHLGKMKCKHCKKETPCKEADEDFLRRRKLGMLKAEFKEEKTLLKEGNYAEAEKMPQQHLESALDDLQEKMLRLLQGDTETAEQIHEEAEEHYSTDAAATPEEKTFWQKYHNWIIFGTGAMLLLAGTAYAASCTIFNSGYAVKNVENMGSRAIISRDAIYRGEGCKYAAPELLKYEKSE